MRDVHHEPRQFIRLTSIVYSKVLPEGGELVDLHGLVGEEVLGELGELRHELVGNQLPLDIKGQASLVDPPVQPRTAVGTVKVLRLKLKQESRVVLREEQILATVIEVVLSNILGLCIDKLRKILIICVVVVLACVHPGLATLDLCMRLPI